MGWNDFLLRSYDAQIGRFLQSDPYDQFAAGYLGMGNDPGNGIDEDGGCYGCQLGTAAELANAPSTIGDVAIIGKKALVGAKAAAQSSSNIGTRLLGLAQGIGGAAISAVSAAAGAGTSWTGAGAVAGGVGFLYGADVAAAGFRQMLSGQSESTISNRVLSGGLKAAGVPAQNAQFITDAAEAVVQLAFFANAASLTKLATPTQQLAVSSQKLARSNIAASKVTSTAGAIGVTRTSSNVLLNTSRQLQAKYKHAGDFGVLGNYSKANAAKFNSAINQHINSSGVQAINGTYRGQSVIHYLNPNTGLNVISSPTGQFISGWKLNPAQLQNVLKHGGL